MLDPKAIEEALANLEADRPLEVYVQNAVDHPLNEQLETLAGELAERGADRVVVRREAIPDLPASPGMALGVAGRHNIRYLAAPEGPEAAPFIEAVAQIGTGLSAVDDWQKSLSGSTDPVQLWVFVAPACPNCPHVVRAAVELSLLSPVITTTVIDAQHFAELAKEYGARSVPLTVVDGGLSITGQLRPRDLAEKLLARGTPEQEAEIFRSLLAVGRFAAAAAQLRSGVALPHFLAGWRASAMSDRMGLMLAADNALEEAAGALDGVVADLIALLGAEDADASLRGDTADLLGKIGLPSAVGPLRGLLGDDNPDVVEIAEEAIAAIADAGRG